ncbi:MAG TPA: response regulator [Myxococcaceae bacterium]|nr:response regulator [Myxococcaceae bacterium]
MPEGRPLILVVDDDPDILDALSEILETEGYEVDRARHGQEALSRIDQRRPDLILLDLMMPVMDGWEFAHALRRREDGAHIPVVVLSADRQASAKARVVGARDFLAKPFELNELLRVVSDSVPQPPHAHA